MSNSPEFDRFPRHLLLYCKQFYKICQVAMSFVSVDLIPIQIPLTITVDEDDQLLLNSADAPWYRSLKFFPELEFRIVGARYYSALYNFNQTRKKQSIKAEACQENKDDATQRLLFERGASEVSD
jgi:hypothetical protein